MPKPFRELACRGQPRRSVWVNNHRAKNDAKLEVLQEEIAKLTVEHGLSAKETHTLVDHVKKGLPPQKALTLIIESGKAQPKTQHSHAKNAAQPT